MPEEPTLRSLLESTSARAASIACYHWQAHFQWHTGLIAIAVILHSVHCFYKLQQYLYFYECYGNSLTSKISLISILNKERSEHLALEYQNHWEGSERTKHHVPRRTAQCAGRMV